MHLVGHTHGVPLATLRDFLARHRPYLAGVVSGLALSVLGYLALVVAALVLRTPDELAVSREEVQVAAVNAYLRTADLRAGTSLFTVVRYGGPSCGGVVELRVYFGEEEEDQKIFTVTQDSGAARGNETPGLTLAQAEADLRARGQRCFRR